MSNNTPVPTETKRRIDIPFAGFYQSHYWADYEDLAWSTEAFDYTYDNMVGRDVEILIARDYVTCLNGLIEDYYGVADLFTPLVMVHPLNMQNADDNISVMIDVDTLPTIKELTAKPMVYDFVEMLKQIAKDKLTSRPGFISFYSPDIATHFDLPYKMWPDAYIKCLLDAMVAAIAFDETLDSLDIDEWDTALCDLELNKFYYGMFGENGGMELYIFESLPQDKADKLYALIGEE